MNRDTISKVNSTDCSDYVNNSCAHDVYSDVTCELMNSGVTGDSDHTVPIHVNSDTLIDESVTDLFNADTVIENEETEASDRVADEPVQEETLDLLTKTDLTLSSIAKLQQSDQDLRLIFDYLQEDKLPLSQKAARKTILEAPDY